MKKTFVFVVVLLIITSVSLKQQKYFTLYSGRQKVNNLMTVNVVNKDEIVRACFDCIYNALLIRKFDEKKVNKDLISSFSNYYDYLSNHQRVKSNAKKCFQIVKESFLQVMLEVELFLCRTIV